MLENDVFLINLRYLLVRVLFPHFSQFWDMSVETEVSSYHSEEVGEAAVAEELESGNPV